MQPIIKVENLSKQYRLGLIGTGSLAHDLNVWWHRLRGKENPYARIGAEALPTRRSGPNEYVWAIRDINFEVSRGQVLGIIGKNGAGKSTLLKILSRTTLPTTGSVKVKGRIASLLEVGTGFHPELTGRENIFLNGAILGMSKREIKRKFDEIVDFSGVEKYIDTPVKRYSSGMYVRLAFAVAAHLEPEILIVDEVLAVGDAEFQKRCLGKMKDVSATDGRTVIFVSHNMQAINTLCSHAIYLRNGIASQKMSAKDAVQIYSTQDSFKNDTTYPIFRSKIVIHDFVVSQNGTPLTEYDGALAIDVLIDFELKEPLTKFRIGFFIKNVYGEILNRSLLGDWNSNYSNLGTGRYIIKGIIPGCFLAAGNYVIQVHTSRYGIEDFGTDEPSSTNIAILPPLNFNSSYIGERPYGSVIIKYDWEFKSVQG